MLAQQVDAIGQGSEVQCVLALHGRAVHHTAAHEVSDGELAIGLCFKTEDAAGRVGVDGNGGAFCPSDVSVGLPAGSVEASTSSILISAATDRKWSGV